MDEVAVLGRSTSSTIHGLGAHVTDSDIKVLLESLSGEDFINTVGELSPFDMVSFLGGLEDLAEQVELWSGDLDLSHGEADTELGCSDVARTESVKVTEELKDADSLLLGEDTDASDHIIDIVGVVADDLSIGVASHGLREVVGAVVEPLVDAE